MIRRVNSSRSSVQSLAVEARMQGEGVSNFAGDCSTPVEMQLFGYPDKVLVGLGIEPERNVSERMHVRCRNCAECLEHRRRLWTARAIAECAASARTWFGTLTLAPDRQVWARYSAIKRLEERQSDVSPDAVFQGMARVVAPEITRFLKRLRKQAALRYLLVTEAHQSGLPHWHLLLHEKDQPIAKRCLEEQWRFGFSHWRLVDHRDAKASGYVCKYLSKSLRTRVRGSQDYGSASALAETLSDRLERAVGAVQVLESVEATNALSNDRPINDEPLTTKSK